MKVLTCALMGANGRPLPRTGTPSEKQESLYYAWSQAKVSVLQQVCEFEEMALEEVKWSQSHHQVECDDVKTATEALQVYWFEVGGCKGLKECYTRKRSIAFAEDTNFQPGRPPAYFLKRSPRYEPGKYTVVDEELDDNHTLPADIAESMQENVFFMGSSEESQGPEDDSDQETITTCDEAEELEEDDGDSDWEDIDSDREDDESSEGSYISFED